MKKKMTIPMLLVTILAFWSSPALAEKIVWQATAMSCTPTSTTAAEKKYVTTGGRIKFKDGKSGRISFICPVTLPSGNGTYYIQGTFANPSYMYGRGNSVQLRQANKRTGAVSTVFSATTRIDGVQSKWGTVESTRKIYPFNQDKHTHWVSFSVSRPTGEGESPALLSVAIIRQ